MALFVLEIEVAGMGILFEAMVKAIADIPSPFPTMPTSIGSLHPLVPPLPAQVAYLRIESTAAFGLLGPYHVSPYYKSALQSRVDGAMNFMEFTSPGARNNIDLRNIYLVGTNPQIYEIGFQVI